MRKYGIFKFLTRLDYKYVNEIHIETSDGFSAISNLPHEHFLSKFQRFSRDYFYKIAKKNGNGKICDSINRRHN